MRESSAERISRGILPGGSWVTGRAACPERPRGPARRRAGTRPSAGRRAREGGDEVRRAGAAASLPRRSVSTSSKARRRWAGAASRIAAASGVHAQLMPRPRREGRRRVAGPARQLGTVAATRPSCAAYSGHRPVRRGGRVRASRRGRGDLGEAGQVPSAARQMPQVLEEEARGSVEPAWRRGVPGERGEAAALLQRKGARHFRRSCSWLSILLRFEASGVRRVGAPREPVRCRPRAHGEASRRPIPGPPGGGAARAASPGPAPARFRLFPGGRSSRARSAAASFGAPGPRDPFGPRAGCRRGEASHRHGAASHASPVPGIPRPRRAPVRPVDAGGRWRTAQSAWPRAS